MKKLLYSSLLVLAALAACTRIAPETSVDLGEDAKAPAIDQVNITGDDSFTAFVTPQSNTSYFAYVVMEGKDAKVNPETLISGGYSKTAIASGVFDSAKAPYAKIECEGLDFATFYTIFAVASNPMGKLSAVAESIVRTPDTTNPELEDWDFEGNMMELYFSEPVEASEGAKVTATVWAKRYPTGTPVQRDVEAAITYVLEDGTVGLEFEDIIIPGSWYIINYAKGTFKDLEGNDCAELPLGKFIVTDGKISDCTGVYGYLKNEELEYNYVVPELVSNYKDYFFTINVPKMVSEVIRASVTVKVVHEEAGKTFTTEYVIPGAPTYGATGLYTVGISLPESPKPGDSFYLTVAKGTIIDIYGNVNDEFTVGPMLYAYDYSLDDILGTYSFTYETQYCGTQYDPEVVIATNEARDSVFFYNMYKNTECLNDLTSYDAFPLTMFGGVFNLSTGTVRLDGDAIGIGALANYSWNNYVCMFGGEDDNDEGYMYFNIDGAGKLSIANEVVMFYLYGLGAWDNALSGELVRTSTDWTIPTATTSVREHCRKPVNFVERLYR